MRKPAGPQSPSKFELRVLVNSDQRGATLRLTRAGKRGIFNPTVSTRMAFWRGTGMEPTSKSRNFVRRWVLATLGGWLLGIVAVGLLGDTLERIGVGGQFPIALGVGLGVGYAQWLVARQWFAASRRWVWASAIGITAPFLIADIVAMRWRALSTADNVTSFLLAVAVGGSLTGWWQRRCLQPRSVRGNMWAVVSGGGWVLAAVVTVFAMVPGHPESALDMWRNLGALPLGGAVLGVVTVVGLVWALKAEGTASPAVGDAVRSLPDSHGSPAVGDRPEDT